MRLLDENEDRHEVEKFAINLAKLGIGALLAALTILAAVASALHWVLS